MPSQEQRGKASTQNGVSGKDLYAIKTVSSYLHRSIFSSIYILQVKPVFVCTEPRVQMQDVCVVVTQAARLVTSPLTL